METKLNIEGMSCEHCAAHVKEALESITGVSSVKVNLKEKNACLTHNDSITTDTLKAAVSEAGYKVV